MKVLAKNIKHNGTHYRVGQKIDDTKLISQLALIEGAFTEPVQASDLIFEDDSIQDSDSTLEDDSNSTNVILTSNLINAMKKTELKEVAKEQGIELVSKKVDEIREEIISKLGL